MLHLFINIKAAETDYRPPLLLSWPDQYSRSLIDLMLHSDLKSMSSVDAYESFFSQGNKATYSNSCKCKWAFCYKISSHVLFFVLFSVSNFFFSLPLFWPQVYRAEERQPDCPHGAGCQLHQWVAAQASLWDSLRLAKAQSKIRLCVGAEWARAPEGRPQRPGEGEGEVRVTTARVSVRHIRKSNKMPRSVCSFLMAFPPEQVFVYWRPVHVPASSQPWPYPGGPSASVRSRRPLQPQWRVWQGGGLFQRCSLCYSAGWWRSQCRDLNVFTLYVLFLSSSFVFLSPIRTICSGISWAPHWPMEAVQRRQWPPTGELWNYSRVSSAVAITWESAV